MNQPIYNAVCELFSRVRRSPGVEQLQKAVYDRAERRFRSLKRQGCSDREAFRTAMQEVGDLNKMVRAARNAENAAKARNARKRVILFIVSVGILLTSAVPMVTLGRSERWHDYGLALMLFIAIIGVLFMIAALGCKPRPIDAAPIAREDFSNEDCNDDGNTRPIYSLARNSVWAMTGIVYLIVSLATAQWKLTWVILLIGFCMTRLAKAVADFFRVGRSAK
ncbi:MAG: hypothetical protein IJC55_04245 [Clostridia bacterium]|nr:hypothetical protein [Clostridia bacterium]